MTELRTMSNQELSRFEVLQRVVDRRLTQQQAAQILGLNRKQIYWLLHAIKCEEAAGLISKRRGRRSNHQLAPGLAAEALALIKEHYPDFGPTLACEKLRGRHHVNLSVEAVRKLMMGAGLWTPRALRDSAVHQPRAGRLLADGTFLFRTLLGLLYFAATRNARGVKRHRSHQGLTGHTCPSHFLPNTY